MVYVQLSRIARIIAGVFVLACSLESSNYVAVADGLTTPYIDPSYFLNIPFGEHSHWAQPWRAYMNTMPASVFVDGTGINFNVDANQAENVATMLGKYGIHRARVEMGWGLFDYNNESQLDDPQIAPILAALRHHGIRPLILLNANSGGPCPMLASSTTLVTDANAGALTVQLGSVQGLVPGYSGLSYVGGYYPVARLLIVAINGNTATLSQPLPVKLSAGTTINITTLKYRPFSTPGGPDFNATMAGWQRYVVNLAAVVRADLGTTGQADGGFDLEVWNELTFGSEFLSTNNYYVPAPVVYTNVFTQVWEPIVAATGTAAQARPDLFSGVLIGDGFANTIPWPASTLEIARISAIDKHPYPPIATYPAGDHEGGNLNAAMQLDPYVPTYSAYFPEYDATFIQTETVIRDMAPLNNAVYGIIHGENARTVNGHASPVSVWITELNVSPVQYNPNISAAAALAIKAKTTARSFSFFLNKGVTQLDLYAAEDTDQGLGIVKDNFLAYAENAAAPYPVNDAAYVSPALLVTSRIMLRMEQGLKRNLMQLRALQVSNVKDANNAIIFRGDGTGVHPNLRAVDVFAFLPYQVNLHRFVIPYYVMTRNVMLNWPQDMFSVTVSGFVPGAQFSVYDPFNDKTSSVRAAPTPSGMQLQLPTSDYPRLLIVDESKPTHSTLLGSNSRVTVSAGLR